MSEEIQRGSRPGGRSGRIQGAVFAATLQILGQHGASAVTIREIALLAGTAETTVYRRWGTVSGVIAAAMENYAVTENPMPDTGSLGGDLSELLGNVAGILERPDARRIFRFAMSLEDGDEALAEARKRFWRVRFDAGAIVVRRAIERGEIPPWVDPEAIIETLVSTAYIRTFLLEKPVTSEVIAESVRCALFSAGAVK